MDAFSSPSVWVVEDNVLQKLQGARIQAAVENVGFPVRWVRLTEPIPITESNQTAAPLLIVHSIQFAHRIGDHVAFSARLGREYVHAHQTVVGYLPALAYTEVLNRYRSIDTVVCGDPEAVVPVLAEHLRRGTDWSTMPGVAFRVGNFGSALTAPRPGRLDQIMLPSCDRSPNRFANHSYVTLETSRGCYHTCSFCLPAQYHRQYRMPYRLRSVANVAAEMESWHDQGVRLYLFDDDQFLPPGNLRYQRVSQFGDSLADLGTRVAFTIKCRADDVDVSLFRHLKQIGLIRVYVGIESGCQVVLDAFDKRVTVDQNLAALALLSEMGITADFRSLLFHPLATLDTIAAEIEFLERACPYVTTLFDWREVQVYPGTAFAGRCNTKSDMLLDPLGYDIPDAKAELLRRCSRIIFGPAGPLDIARGRVTELWFQQLLNEHLTQANVNTQRMRIITSVNEINKAMLGLWRDMLETVSQDSVPTAAEVNALIGDWMMRLRSAIDIAHL